MKVLETSNILKRRDALGRIGGWAPGGYLFICIGCGTHGVDGDKRATQCFACAAVAEIERLRKGWPKILPLTGELRPFAEYHEDMHDVLWWRFPICEPPWVGSPLCLGYTVRASINGTDVGEVMIGGWKDDYYTHFTPIPIPEAP